MKNQISYKLTIRMEKIVKLILSLLFFVCVLDPASLLTHLKVPLFLLVLIIGFLFIIWKEGKITVNKNIVIYFSLFSIFVPTIALINAVAFNFFDLSHFNILGTLKNYAFLCLIFLLYDLNINSLRLLIRALTTLSIIIIIFYLIIHFKTELTSVLNNFGQRYKIYKFAPANLLGINYVRIYFWTSPLIVLSIGYYANKFSYKKSLKFFILLLINVLGMFISGSRINVFFSIFVPFTIIFIQHFSSKKFMLLFLLITFLMIYAFSHNLFVMGINGTGSDHVKLNMISQYFDIYFLNIRHFLIGEGMGAGFLIKSRNIYLTFTELTYFEIFRKYGFLLGGFLIYLMFIPLKFYTKIDKNDRWIIFVYFCFLVMAFFNPFYFSSSGFLLLMFVLLTIFKKHNVKSKIYE